GKGIIKFATINIVPAEIELVVDDAEDRRIHKLVDGKESTIGIAAGFGRRKAELDLRYERFRRREKRPSGNEHGDRHYEKNYCGNQRNSPRRPQDSHDLAKLQLLLFLRCNALRGRIENIHR